MNSAMGHETYWKSRIVVETHFSKKKKKKPQTLEQIISIQMDTKYIYI